MAKTKKNLRPRQVHGMGVAAMLTATGAAYADVAEDVVDFMGYEVPLRDSEMTIE